MIVSAKAEYACLAMLELTLRHGEAKPARLADIAERHGIPQRFLVQIMLQLKGAGLVASTRGASGGYQLAKPPDEIALQDVLDVVDRTDSATNKPARPSRGGEASALAEGLHAVWERVHRARQDILRQTTLADLASSGHGLHYVI